MRRHAVVIAMFVMFSAAPNVVGHPIRLRPEKHSMSLSAVIQVNYFSADDLADQIRSVYPNHAWLSIVADVPSNRLIVYAEPGVLRDIRNVIDDVEGAGMRRYMNSLFEAHRLQNARIWVDSSQPALNFGLPAGRFGPVQMTPVFPLGGIGQIAR
jgi:hypothetical protein